jgi:hypothetical protein
MDSGDRTAIAARLMSEFATRTGLPPSTQDQQRYLWTDAFAVCNFLELFNRTGDKKYQHYARDLIDRVHQVLGRYRCDDARSGWRLSEDLFGSCSPERLPASTGR